MSDGGSSMTTLQKEIKKCAHCGCENEFDVVCSTSTFGPSDLDTRPAPLARYNILYGVQRCKKCNYCNENIEEKVDFDEAILTSKNYLKVINSNYPELAKNYMLASIIMESVMRYGDAGIFMLQACWVLDDEGLDAKKTRIVAAKLLEKEFVMDAYRLIAIDLYRRAEEFEAAKILINKSKFFIEDVYMKKVLKCEEVLVDIFDSECHDCSEIEKFIGESELEEKLKADTPEEVLRKLFDEESTESLYLYNDKGSCFRTNCYNST